MLSGREPFICKRANRNRTRYSGEVRQSHEKDELRMLLETVGK